MKAVMLSFHMNARGARILDTIDFRDSRVEAIRLVLKKAIVRMGNTEGVRRVELDDPRVTLISDDSECRGRFGVSKANKKWSRLPLQLAGILPLLRTLSRSSSYEMDQVWKNQEINQRNHQKM